MTTAGSFYFWMIRENAGWFWMYFIAVNALVSFKDFFWMKHKFENVALHESNCLPSYGDNVSW